MFIRHSGRVRACPAYGFVRVHPHTHWWLEILEDGSILFNFLLLLLFAPCANRDLPAIECSGLMYAPALPLWNKVAKNNTLSFNLAVSFSHQVQQPVLVPQSCHIKD